MRELAIDSRVQPIVNLARRPISSSFTNVPGNFIYWGRGRWFGGSGATGVHTIEGEPGDPHIRKTWTERSSNTTDTGFDLGSSGTLAYPVTPGEVLTGSAFLNPSSEGKRGVFEADWYSEDGTRILSMIGLQAPLPANEWTRISASFTAPEDAVWVKFVADIASGGTPWEVGDWLEGNHVMLTLGPHLHPYLDGDSPGARWLGAPNVSISAGYVDLPFEIPLEAIAGPPVLDRDTPGTSHRIASDPYEDVTLFAVVDWYGGVSEGYLTPARVGPTSASGGRVSIQANQAGSDGVGYRFDAPEGSSNFVSYVAGGKSGVNAHCARTQEGMTRIQARHARSSWITSGAADPGLGFTTRDLNLSASGIESTVLRAFYYPRTLTDTEVTRVFGWLADKYGTPRPA